MTIGECLEEIRRHFLEEDFAFLSIAGMQILRTVKFENGSQDGTYPKKGWLIYLNQEDETLSLIHRDYPYPIPIQLPEKRSHS